MPKDMLIQSDDPRLIEELEEALASLGDAAPVHRVAESRSRAVQLMQNRLPDLVLFPLTSDLDSARRFAQEVHTVSPSTLLVAVFQPEVLSHDESESSFLIEAMRLGVKDFLRRPISSNELDRLLRESGRMEELSATDDCTVVSFVSNKGGVGKSTMSVNTAVGLALRNPERVLLIDASLQMGVVAPMLDLSGAPTLTNVARERGRLDLTMIRQIATLHESGLYVIPAPADAIEAAEIDDELMTRVITLARRAFDYVVIDTFPLIDRVIMSVLDMSDLAFVVTENVVPTLLGAVKMIEVLERIGFAEEKQRIILNRYTNIAGSVTAEDVANRMQRAVNHVVPYDKKVVTASNTGMPFVSQTLRLSKTQRAIAGIVSEVESVANSTNPALSPDGGES